jgi:hypothetical protein
MTIDVAAAAVLNPVAPAAGAAAGQVQAGYGVSLTDFAGFQQAMAGVAARLEAAPAAVPSEAAKVLFTPFEHINTEAARLSADAQAAKDSGQEMKPGEVVMLSARSMEFMFHCQLMSSIANKTSEGLQQLFRQQS